MRGEEPSRSPASAVVCLLMHLSACASVHDGDAAMVVRVEAFSETTFLEGPAWSDELGLLFTDIPGNRILRLLSNGHVETWKSPSLKSNGLTFDLEGRLVAAENDGRRVVRHEADGSITVLAESFQGEPLNSPNDVAIDRSGRIFFTDPAYRDRETKQRRDRSDEVVDGIYRVDPSGEIVLFSDHLVDMPNGLVVSPDGRCMYVADNDAFNASGARKLWRFALSESGDIEPDSRSLIFDWGTDGGPDGMAVDVDGRVYVAAGLSTATPHNTVETYGAGIYIFSAEGELVQTIPIDAEVVSNVTFGGAARDTLYITTNDSIWRATPLARGLR